MRVWGSRALPLSAVLFAAVLASCVAAGEPAPSAPSVVPVGNPTSSGDSLPFSSATYLLAVHGPDSLGCPDLFRSRLGHVVMTTIALKFDGEIWRGEPRSPAAGVFGLTLTGGPPVGGPGGGPGVSGGLSGLVVSTIGISSTLGLDGPVPDLRAAFEEAPAALTGGISQDGAIASGRLIGDVVFSNSSGASAACTGANMSWMVSLIAE